MKQESQPIVPDTGNASGGTNRNADKYQRILDAAVAVFAEKGFFNSRISDIADRADVADGTVYLYFKNKEEMPSCATHARKWRSSPAPPSACGGWLFFIWMR
jgi:predicted transcriptional regulator YheO